MSESTTSLSSDVPSIGHEDTPGPGHTRSQRSRRVKSARKLMKVLGENPMPHFDMLSPMSPISFPQKKSRKGSAATLYSPILSVTKKLVRVALEPLQVVYRRDSDTEWEDTGSSKSEPAGLSHGFGRSPVLYLQTQARPESDIDGHTSYISTQTPSPSASSFRKRPSSLFSVSTSRSFLPSPPEWEKWKEEREARHRRRRVSKLARFLGERIPPDLVLPKPGSAKSNIGSPRRRFPPLITPPITPVVSPIQQSASPTSSQQGTPLSLSPPSSLAEGPRPAVEKTVEFFETTTESRPSSPDAARELSISLPHDGSMQPRPDPYFEVDDHVDIVSVSLEDEKEPEDSPLMVSPPRSESRLAFLRLRSAAPSPEPRVYSHRSERRQGWSGEWNVASMQDVITKLRDLR